MKFFFDENISHVIAKALSCLERDDKPDFADKVYIRHLFDEYDESKRPVADETWIPEMTKIGFVIITVDHAQKRNRGKHAAEAQAYRDNNAIAFWLPRSFVSASGKQKWEQASRLFKWWPAIVDAATSANPGDLFDIDDKGEPKLRS